ncbi:MAG: GNAT family N-acetyltransferase [Sediminimonas qiaohouensis]|uniref:GNAT family N-acetyltransferase n=1 Tax=Sediminimonas qiaohouensis TaxID=552061 RepID=A0A7C9LQI1_9RHOB|nr:GNAT family N-acetyltransferase [Sediminimonas qiaohouensis]MTJ03616.1 GNAT family N-acetyltransferase [Sediminimonas qiaohouensis]
MKLEKITDQPVIAAEAFDLRPVRGSDLGLVEMYCGDARVASNTSTIPHPLPPGAIEAYIRRAQQPDRIEDVWVMDGSKAGASEVMGLITLARMDRNQSEISYWVAPAYWNTGVASAAVRALLEANPQKCETLFAEVFQDNPASARVLTNCGFEYLGDAETYCVARAAKVPTWTYSRKLD